MIVKNKLSLHYFDRHVNRFEAVINIIFVLYKTWKIKGLNLRTTERILPIYSGVLE